ncbi:MAG: hypothetical protein PVJ11_09935, partial [Syntrophobacterales bacterium]
QDDLSALRFQVSGVRFQLLSFFFLTPDPPPAEHLEHYDLMLGNRGPARRVGCPKDQFGFSNAPSLGGDQTWILHFLRKANRGIKIEPI